MTSDYGGPWKLIPARMCEKLVGLGDVDLFGINDSGEQTPIGVVIRSRRPRPTSEACGGRVWSKGYRTAVLVDLPAFGRPVRLRWRKRRWTCPDSGCAVRSFVEQDATVAPQRALLTSRAARWVTTQVGRRGRPVDEVAEELGCDWHTVADEVRCWGEALLEADTNRVGKVEAVGVDETLFWRRGKLCNQATYPRRHPTSKRYSGPSRNGAAPGTSRGDRSKWTVVSIGERNGWLSCSLELR